MGTGTAFWRRWRSVTLAAVMLAGGSLLAGAGTAPAAPRDTNATTGTHDSALEDALTNVLVRTELLTKLGWDALHIDVDVHGSEVILSGTVTKRSTQGLAKEVTLAVSGVQDVRDEIRVADTPGEGRVTRTVDRAEREVHDALLQVRVKGRLLEEIGREAIHVEVEATDGVVSLRGTVPTAAQRDVAVQTAQQTKGVTKVVDLIRTAS